MACKYIYKGTTYTKEQFESFVKEEFVKKSPENQFLSLLEKDSNWVTFFIKSIISDSAKKGYEKVLFPTGDTASKIEGHSTLEEFKKQKENRIKELEKDIIDYTKDKENASKRGDKEQVERSDRGIETRNNEINQLKQELERIEGPEGFAALKPIYNFYENTVKNILVKQYGKENVKQITDEYGNTWNEITINPNRDNGVIYLQNKLNENKPVSPKMLKFVKEFIKQIGVDYQKVDKIVVNGKIVDANGIARMMSKLIQVVEGKETVVVSSFCFSVVGVQAARETAITAAIIPNNHFFI
jgi:hypothetical protein